MTACCRWFIQPEIETTRNEKGSKIALLAAGYHARHPVPVHGRIELLDHTRFVVAMKRSNVRRAKKPCCTSCRCGTGRRGELINAPINLQDRKHRLCVPRKAPLWGHINRDVKSAGARSAGNSHAACDVAGVGDGITELPKRARRKVETPDTAKELPTDLRASARPYQVGATGIPAISVNFQIKRTSSVSRTLHLWNV